MEEFVLILKEKTTQHWLFYFQTTCKS